MKNKLIKKMMLFAFIFLLFFVGDLLLKHFFFETPITNKPTYDWRVIGIRSNAHYGTTVLDFLKINISTTWSTVIFATIATLFITMMFFAKNKFTIIAISITIAGIFGNGLDVIFHGYVRNIFYMPWHDSGTFNFADVLIVVGAPLTAVGILWSTFKK